MRVSRSFVAASSIGVAISLLAFLTAAPTNAASGSSRSHRKSTAARTKTHSARAPRHTSFAAFSDGFESYPTTTWVDGSTHGSWLQVYNGYGTVGITTDGSHVLSESPQISTSDAETHAGMVASTQSFGDLDFSVRMRTVRQLRVGSSPNTWEVGWVLWHYTDDAHFYSFLPKPNGWELGKEDPAYPGDQRYLSTGSSPTFPIGAWYTVRVRQVGATMTVWVNGKAVVSATDTERPYRTGPVALYNEDATVHFDDAKITRL